MTLLQMILPFLSNPTRTARVCLGTGLIALLVLALLAAGCKPEPRSDDEDLKAPSEKTEKAAVPAAVEAALPPGTRWESQVYRLRVRSAARKDAPIVGHLAKGEIVAQLESSPKAVTISGRQGRWIKIQTQSKVTGWVFSGFLTKQ